MHLRSDVVMFSDAESRGVKRKQPDDDNEDVD